MRPIILILIALLMLICVLLFLKYEAADEDAQTLFLKYKAVDADAQKWGAFEIVLADGYWDSCGLAKDGGTYCTRLLAGFNEEKGGR